LDEKSIASKPSSLMIHLLGKVIRASMMADRKRGNDHGESAYSREVLLDHDCLHRGWNIRSRHLPFNFKLGHHLARSVLS
jgi:hypothetical protein